MQEHQLIELEHPIPNKTSSHKPITKRNGRKNNYYNTLSLRQHVDEQTKDVSNSKLKFGISRVPKSASVPLNENSNLEKFEYCSKRVPIEPRVQRISHEQKLLNEQKIQASTTRVPIYSGDS